MIFDKMIFKVEVVDAFHALMYQPRKKITFKIEILSISDNS